MPSIKENCVCQICICGQHHCGNKNSFDAEEETPQSNHLIDECLQTNDCLPWAQSEPVKTFNEESDKERESSTISSITTTTTTKIIKKATVHLAKDNQIEAKNKNIQSSETVNENMEAQTQPRRQDDDEFDETGEFAAEIDPTAPSFIRKNTTAQRKQWQTSPEQVQELTRSLSRMRATEMDDSYSYEKLKESQMLTSKPKKTNTQAKTTEMNNNTNNNNHSKLPSKVLPSGCNNNRSNQPAQRESFLPPLTGFSDSDSFEFRSSPSSTGDVCCAGLGNNTNGKIQCICETLKQTRLEEKIKMPMPTVDCIDVNADNWIVTKPKKIRPRDNLRLEGSMDLETTFHSTYDDTAQRMIRSTNSRESKSKRSTATTSSSNRSCKNSFNGLYLNTRRGRAVNGTTMLSSARRRRTVRNRPQTSLKTGGHGYYHTINQDAYKNFKFVNGEVKTVPDQVRLPKVTTKTLTTTTKMTKDDKQKYVNKTKIVKMEQKLVQDGAKNEKTENEDEKIVMFDDEELYEKMIRSTKAEPSPEDDQEEKSNERRTEEGVKTLTNEMDKKDKHQGMIQLKQSENRNWTVNRNNARKKRYFMTQDVDNIQDLGLLNSSSVDFEGHPMPGFRKSSHKDFRPHIRKLHETSEELRVKNEKVNNTKTLPLEKVKENETETKPLQYETVSGHAVMAASHKPFIMPQRVYRHKNDCSVNAFEGEMNFTTTNRSAFGEARNTRISSAQRKRTAGRRYLKSSKRRNLFRQSSDSMFAAPDDSKPIKSTMQQQTKRETMATRQQMKQHADSTYRSEYDDHLYCPALDVNNRVNVNDKFLYTGEAGGHKYYLKSDYK